MKIDKSLLLLAIIVLLGIGLRYFKLGQAPAGLYLDEAGQGYSAYSILKTGKDEFGMPFPAAFRSFNDFKTPVYIYLIVPLIPIFGLNAFTIRFPSFFFSMLTLPLLYLMIINLTNKSKSSRSIAFTSVLFLALSPWHILFGRTNFECNVALFLLLLGFYLFHLALRSPKILTFSAIAFAAALPAYHSERLLVPMIIIFLFVRYRRILLSSSHINHTFLSLVLGVILSIPTIKILLTPGFMARVSALSIFNGVGTGPQEWASLYLSYFSPRQLFWLGDSGPRSSFPDLSVMYLWQLPLYLSGLYLLFSTKIPRKLKEFVLLFLFLSPIPASLTRDPFSTIRSLPLVVPFSIICALPAVLIFEKVKNIFVKVLLVFGIVIYSITKLYSSGYVLNEYYRAYYWDYGWEQVVHIIKNKLDPDLPVIVDNARAEPYSQLLVFLEADPIKYQKDNFEVSNDNYYSYMGRNMTKKIGNITTRGINWTEDKKIDQYLIGDYLAISLEQIKENNLVLIEEIAYPDGSPAYRIVKTKP